MDTFDTLRKFTRVRSEVTAEEKPKRTKRTKRKVKKDPPADLPADETPSLAQIISRAQIASLATSPTIADIAAMIPLDMTAVTDVHGYIADSSTIAIKCDRAHIHKYFLSDVARGSISCQTCTYGTKFIKMAREVAEQLLGVPFVIQASDFVNIPLGIKLTCHRAAGVDSATVIGDQIHIHAYVTESRRKIAKLLHTHLNQWRITEQMRLSLESATYTRVKTARQRPLLRRYIYVPPELESLYLEDFVVSGIQL